MNHDLCQKRAEEYVDKLRAMKSFAPVVEEVFLSAGTAFEAGFRQGYNEATAAAHRRETPEPQPEVT